MNTEQRNNATKTMLGLKLPTDPRWVNVAEKNIGEILIDHAYCEQKAASSCISLIIQYPEKEKLREVLMPVVSEEWAHFRMVLKEMDARGIELGKQRRDEYVHQLYNSMRHGGSRDEQLGERLFLNALIEARSCERFRILSQEISDESLREFYHELMISEAGHYVNFIDLAKEYLSAQYVKTRWEEWLETEAEVIKNLEVRGDRVH
ncbi:tRNA-(ms[2]io[6]A)-hydroxylase [Arcicella sp. LKC2W]|uniref:tRNA-(ms[2]io[6]A)-hydroxylase n=1 Tax=Arcicella sp. LKC2W TaxID=2984198 RepID=UPI002B1F346C|nr:tRNA-(ms[2]io[6]A)-hydroxylase [Arcicella sp. LKC2W]MEA5459839.1 tRNA-(ms[2]io[6]A)-hydroxylase [Arcicella sp. LKC2W]